MHKVTAQSLHQTAQSSAHNISPLRSRGSVCALCAVCSWGAES